MQTLITFAITTALSILGAAIVALLSALVLMLAIRWFLKFDYPYAAAYKVSLASGIAGAITGAAIEVLMPLLRLSEGVVAALSVVLGLAITLAFYATWIVRPGRGPIGIGGAIQALLGQLLISVALVAVVLGMVYFVFGNLMELP